MHELMNIPETALGQVQGISNTSGVALAIQFQPLMNRWTQKTSVYGKGLERINELILLNLAVKEPETFQYNPDTDGPIGEDQLTALDPNDPLTYVTYAQFKSPLPLDRIVLLNELSQMMSMGLESKEGALRAMGEEFPQEKLAEIRAELVEDAQAEGALNLLKVQIQKQIIDLTGFMAGPDGTATPIDPMMMGDGDELGDGQIGPQVGGKGVDPAVQQQNLQAESDVRQTLLNDAFGTKVPTRRTVDKE
jgi:hypothetical protein